MIELSRTRSVLDFTSVSGEIAWFHNDRHGLALDKTVWVELGHPTRITVQIEPGDTLTGEAG